MGDQVSLAGIAADRMVAGASGEQTLIIININNICKIYAPAYGFARNRFMDLEKIKVIPACNR